MEGRTGCRGFTLGLQPSGQVFRLCHAGFGPGTGKRSYVPLKLEAVVALMSGGGRFCPREGDQSWSRASPAVGLLRK